jgi:hypothetical protein
MFIIFVSESDKLQGRRDGNLPNGNIPLFSLFGLSLVIVWKIMVNKISFFEYKISFKEKSYLEDIMAFMFPDHEKQWNEQRKEDRCKWWAKYNSNKPNPFCAELLSKEFLHIRILHENPDNTIEFLNLKCSRGKTDVVSQDKEKFLMLLNVELKCSIENRE